MKSRLDFTIKQCRKKQKRDKKKRRGTGDAIFAQRSLLTAIQEVAERCLADPTAENLKKNQNVDKMVHTNS